MLPPVAGPTVRRLRLGRELRRLREAAGVGRVDAAEAIGCSKARIDHIESGRNTPTKSDLVVLLKHLYGADDTTLQTLEILREEGSKRGWWSTYGLPQWLAVYVGLETDASVLRCVDLELIPGLLQTDSYMHHLYAVDRPRPDKEVDRRIQARLHRQQRLIDTQDPLQLIAVVSEGALVRCMHESFGAEQLDQLIMRSQQPNIDLRVLPFEIGVHIGTGPFSILSFPDDLLPDAAHYEHAVGGYVIDDLLIVERLSTVFAELRDRSLGADESRALIAQLRKRSET